uniref:Uncharacterized protein n=1 Tax=Stomoxys calcitrans TaxID=35570 RepID=A0A1I8NXI8_STOCA
MLAAVRIVFFNKNIELSLIWIIVQTFYYYKLLLLMAPKIPDRWLDYKSVGNRIDGTRFVAFKVPLNPHVFNESEKDIRFDVKMLLEQIPNLGVIIDLTNTNRYYDAKFFKQEGIEHQKLMIPGHVTPAQSLVDIFKDYVKRFLRKNPDNDKLIGVHCTHGVNRTGYLICNYMVSEMDVNANEAIDKFALARGHKIERNNYLDALKKLKAHKGESNRKSYDNDRSSPHHEHSSRYGNRERERHEDRDDSRNRNWRLGDRNHRDRISAYNQNNRNPYSWRKQKHSDGAKDEPPPKIMAIRSYEHFGGRRHTNDSYSQQCRRQQGYEEMDFRKHNNNNNSHRHNNSGDYYHKNSRPYENRQDDRPTTTNHYHHREDNLYRKDNRNSRRSSSPPSSSQGHKGNNSYRNRN